MSARTDSPSVFNSLQSFQQPRAAFFLAVRMDVVLDLMMVLNLDLYLGWYGLCLYLVCVRIQTYTNECTCIFVNLRCAGAHHPPLQDKSAQPANPERSRTHVVVGVGVLGGPAADART